MAAGKKNNAARLDLQKRAAFQIKFRELFPAGFPRFNEG